MKILLTGASGFIGGHLVLGLSKAGFEITAVCGQNPPSTAVAAASASVESCDLRDEAAVRSLAKSVAADAVVHTAAITSTAICQEDPALARAINACGTDTLCAAALASAKGDAPLFVYFSTDLVFDGCTPPESGFCEDQPAKPASTYARSKLEGEEFVRRYGGRSAVLRTALTYGAPVGEKEGFMGWLRGGLAEGKEVSCFIDEFRTPVCTNDIVKTVIALLRADKSSIASQELIHLGGPERISRYEFGLKVAHAFEYDPLLVRGNYLDDVETPAPRAKDASLCIDKLRKLLAIEPCDPSSELARLAQTRV